MTQQQQRRCVVRTKGITERVYDPRVKVQLRDVAKRTILTKDPGALFDPQQLWTTFWVWTVLPLETLRHVDNVINAEECEP